MFRELEDLESIEDADLCIVGAGAAGIALAREFDGAGKRVLLMEGGGLTYEVDTQSLNSGKNTGLDYPALTSTRLRFFGGTTNHWAGQSTPLDPIDFSKRDWVPNSGWPIKYEAFKPYISKASEVCKLTVDSFSTEVWDERLGQAFDSPGIERCVFGYPEPIIRFGQDYRSQIEVSSNIECVLHANATKVNTNSDGDLKSIEFKSLSGETKVVRAKKYVLACGALQTIKLLLNSSLEEGGIDNAKGLIGKYFMEHPNFPTSVVDIDTDTVSPYLIKPRQSVKGSEVRIDFKLSEEEQRRLKVLNHTAYLFEAPKRKTSDSWKGNINKFLNKVEAKIESVMDSKTYSFKFRLEHAPNEDSFVKLSEDKDELGLRQLSLNLKFSKLEATTIKKVMEEFSRHFGANHIGKVELDFDPSSHWEKKVGWQYHHFGGTRMSQSSADGVVDENLRCHSHKNLFIASTSTFPTGGHANPTLNLIALTLRLADYLKQEDSLNAI